MTGVLTDGTISLMASLAQRLRWCIQERGISARQLSLQAGLSAGTVQKILERDSSRVDVRDLIRIADVARVSRAWLALGEGAPDAENPPESLKLGDEPEQALGAEVSQLAVEALGRSLGAFRAAGDEDGYDLALQVLQRLRTGARSEESGVPAQAEARPRSA